MHSECEGHGFLFKTYRSISPPPDPSIGLLNQFSNYSFLQIF